MAEIGLGWAMVVQMLAGVSLAACCGLRAFLPPFIAGLATRLGLPEFLLGHALELNPAFAWISSTPALVIFGTAVVVEVLADKIPVVDHMLDAVQTFVRPLAGLLVVAVSLPSLSPLEASIAGLLVGSPLAFGVHLTKAKIRLTSTMGTAGLASPVLSLVEDGVALGGSILAMVAALLAAVLTLFGLLMTWYILRVFFRRVYRLQER